jgi:hypothetical protein
MSLGYIERPTTISTSSSFTDLVVDGKVSINSTTATLGPPVMSGAQRDAIAAPQQGGIVFNGDSGCLNNYNGGAWGSVSTAPLVTTTRGVVRWAATDGSYVQDTSDVLIDDGSVMTQTRTGSGTALNQIRVEATGAVPSNRLCGQIMTKFGYDGASYISGPNIQFVTNGTVTATSAPSRIDVLVPAVGETGTDNGALRFRLTGDEAHGIKGNLCLNDVELGVPVATAVLEVVSTTKGFLPPRHTTTQRDAVTTPAAGLVVYNTTTNKLNVYTGAAWEAITSA